jgi:hypothetical protein
VRMRNVRDAAPEGMARRPRRACTRLPVPSLRRFAQHEKGRHANDASLERLAAHANRSPGALRCRGRSGLWVWEETSNQAITRGFKFWIEGKGVQQKIARMMTKTGVRHALVLSWGEKQIRPKYVVVPYEDWCGLVKESIE